MVCVCGVCVGVGRGMLLNLLYGTDVWLEFFSQSVSQIFKVARQLSHIGAMPEKSGLVLLNDWVGLMYDS